MKNRNVVIIGGSTGIGLETSEILKKQGVNTFLYSKSGNRTQTFDATNDGEELIGLPEVIDGLVYCPGTIKLKPFHRLSLEDFRGEMDVNFYGAVRVLQTCLKGLKKSDSASVILFSTVAAQMGMTFHSGIASAKGAVEGLTRSLAAEWAPQKIRVNAIAPSLTDTPLAGQLLSTPEKKEASDRRHPIGRVGTAKDIASMVVHLLSDDASWMTGQILHVDGGMSVIR